MSRHLEAVLSACALIISMASLAATFWQAELTRTHNKLSVRPKIISTHHLYGSDGKNGIYLSNVGLGPAIITGLKVEVNGNSYSGLGTNRWPEALRAININSSCFRQAWPLRESTLKSSEEVALIELTAEKPKECLVDLLRLLVANGVTITLDYESMYNEPASHKATLKIDDEAAKNLLKLATK